MNISRLSLPKRMMISAWLLWERLFHTWFAVVPLDPRNRMFYYRICRYHGKPIVTSDKETIVSGDRVVELHFNNENLIELVREARSVVHLAAQLIQHTKHMLPFLAEKFERDPDFQGLKGVYGITMVHQGSHRLGFTVSDLPRGLFRSFTRMYLTVLMYIVHPEGKRKLHAKKAVFVPKLLAISAKELQKLHGTYESKDQGTEH